MIRLPARSAARPPRDAAPNAAAPRAPVRPLSDAERDELESLLDRAPPPLEPLDVCLLDGYLCGVLVQPRRVPAAAWRAHVTDVDGRALPRVLPPGFDASRLQALVERRHAELDDAIGRRQWFDPWVFELQDDDATTAVYPWVAGFATALELFPELVLTEAVALTEPLALLYRHLAPDDLEQADALLAEIEALEPPADLAEAVEGLVRATLLLADVGRPLPAAAARPPAPGGFRAAPRQSGRSDR